MDNESDASLTALLERAAPHTAARFPHVIRRLAGTWADPEACRAFFHSLLVDVSPGQQGFPLDVMLELMHLSEHYEIGLSNDREGDAWSANEPML
ncbi:hypothetical protein EZJ19_06445 [Parasulfuritortus cantonensis]|uniref:Uncharacterized protein n=1 Tax=Parasulfuritortus cantonensis TaxID=2528202 RepID=A0A4R1BF30_9PROT|nr:hypothetical protein [Parasulfuritortus cantonensis]TCJ15704.1 hypothetical protein EZJ19_06445 [Parasulfuritortus cantonensis]